MSLLAIDADMTSRLLDEAMHHGEAEPRPFALRLGGEERLEDPIENLGADAGAGVAHAQKNVLAGLDVAEPADIGVIEIGSWPSRW